LVRIVDASHFTDGMAKRSRRLTLGSTAVFIRVSGMGWRDSRHCM
jgi:hypothetical protein